jgi:hypothetical protein
MSQITLPALQFFDPEGNPVAYGYVDISVSVDCQSTSDTQIGKGSVATIPLDATGIITGSYPIWQNSSLTPSGSYYIIKVYTSSGQLVQGPDIITF